MGRQPHGIHLVCRRQQYQFQNDLDWRDATMRGDRAEDAVAEKVKQEQDVGISHEAEKSIA